MTNTPFLVALVLAGGKSSRMGRDKALILWDGQPMLQRVVGAIRQLPLLSSVYILTPWPDRYQGSVTGDVQWLVESNPGKGPLIALAQGFAQIEAEWILLVACDMPQLDSGILHQWSQKLSILPPEILALVPQSAERWEPMCGFYRKEAGKALEVFIQAGGRSLQGWLKQIPVSSIPVDRAASLMLKNCNKPEDLAKNQTDIGENFRHNIGQKL
jgi:molybdopterin-guanine dinucleotide biosynthesis protein A